MNKLQFNRWVALILVLSLLCLPGCMGPKVGPFQIEIRTAEQLRKLMPGADYVLAADIDLGGESWEPLDFGGSLDGCGYTISNVTITQSVDGNTGFFGCLEGTVQNLHLENVTLTADAEYAGLLAGTNRGTIENCTVTGSITDDRAESCVGVMVGNNEGKVLSGSNTLTATAGSSNPEDKAENLSACVSLFFPEGRSHKLGIAGKTDVANMDLSMTWRDTTGSFDRLPETEQQRRQAVADMMRTMGTVQWTVSEEITYTANDNRKSVHSNAFLPGRTYVGLPYSGCEGSYERFMTQMQAQQDSEGRYVTVTGLENGIKTKSGDVSGFITDMGNDCVGAVIWALSAGVPYSVEDQGMEFLSPIEMVPNAYNTENFGALSAGGYQVIESNTDKYQDGLDARDTRTIIAINGGAVEMAEYYAKAYRGDYLLCLTYTYKPETDTWKKTANHGRMLAWEPMIIRTWDGYIDLEKSYVLTHEQGDGLYDNRLENGEYETYQGYNLKQTSWRTDYKYSLSLLMTAEGFNNGYLPGTGYGYVPVTVGTYTRQEQVPFACKQVERGIYESNYLMVSATMTVTNGENTVYEKTAYLPYRVFSDFTRLEVAELFPDLEESLTQGQTYYKTLTATATGGTTCTVVDNEAFTK